MFGERDIVIKLKNVNFKVFLVSIPLLVGFPSLHGLITGTWNMEVCAGEYVPTFEKISAGTGDQLETTTTTVTAVGLITGTVTDLVTGYPIEGAEVSTNGLGYDISDVEGKYYIHEIPGTWVMEVHANGYAPFSMGVTVRTGRTTVVDIMLDPIGASTSTAVTTTTARSTTTTICQCLLLYGEDSEETELLRYIRDNKLNQTSEGKELIKLYYQLSPMIVRAMENDEEFRKKLKEMIDGVLGLVMEEAE